MKNWLRQLRDFTRRRQLSKMIQTMDQLPADPSTFEDMTLWQQWLERWEHHITFHRYHARLGESLHYASRYNNLEEYLSSYRMVSRAIEKRTQINLPETAYLPGRELNLDYFLTTTKGHSIPITTAYQQLRTAVQFFSHQGIELQTDLDSDRQTFQYYRLRSTGVMTDTIALLVRLITASDLFQQSSVE